MVAFIIPEDLGIKGINKSETESAVKFIKKIESSSSAFDKMNCVLSAINALNSCVKFSTGKDEDGGADNITPLLHYSIIQAMPEKFITNIYFMKAFVNDQDNGVAAFTISQLEQAVSFINSLA